MKYKLKFIYDVYRGYAGFNKNLQSMGQQFNFDDYTTIFTDSINKSDRPNRRFIKVLKYKHDKYFTVSLDDGDGRSSIPEGMGLLKEINHTLLPDDIGDTWEDGNNDRQYVSACFLLYIKSGGEPQFPSFRRRGGRDIKVIESLISKGADIDYELNWTLKCLSNYGHLEVIKFLMSENKIGFAQELLDKCLLRACKHNHYKTAKFFIRKGASPIYRHSKCLYYSTIRGNFKLYNYLLEHGANAKSMRHYCLKKDM